MQRKSTRAAEWQRGSWDRLLVERCGKKERAGLSRGRLVRSKDELWFCGLEGGVAILAANRFFQTFFSVILAVHHRFCGVDDLFGRVFPSVGVALRRLVGGQSRVQFKQLCLLFLGSLAVGYSGE